MSHPSSRGVGKVAFAPSRDSWWPLADRPVLALVVVFLAGIWVGSRWQMAPLWIGLGLLGASTALIVRGPWVGRGALCVGALACGALLYAYQHRLPSDDVTRLVEAGSVVTVEGFVTAELPWRSDARTLVLSVRRLKASRGWRQASGKLLVHVRGVEGALDGLAVRCEGRAAPPSRGTNPGQFDYGAALARRQVGMILSARTLVKTQSAPVAIGVWARRQAAACRRSIVERLRQSMPGSNAQYYTGLLAGIVFGMEVTPVPEATAESFRRTGTIHLLVVSGAQVTMIASAVLFLLRARRLRWWHGIIVAAPLAFFALMVGTGPSVARALAMCVLFLIGRIGQADYDPYTALGLAALAICAFETEALFSIGAQLSFAATLGVLVGIRSLPRPRGAISSRVKTALIVVAAAAGSWLIVTPLLAYYFAAFPLSGAIANLIVVPLCAVVMACAALTIPISFISVGIAAAPAWAARSILAAMVSVNEVCAQLPLAYASSARFSVLDCLGWYAALAVGAVVVRGRWWERLTPKRLLALGLGLAFILAFWFAVSAYRPGELAVTFLDVGHGQCCVVKAPSGRTMMVDAGSRYSAREGQRCARDVILPFLAHRRLDRLDIVVLTHPDADHCNALAPVLNEVPVGLILESFPAPDEKLYSQVAAAAAQRHVRIERTFAGGRIDLGEGVCADVLWPSGTPSDQTFSENDRSVVLLLRYGRTRILLASDIGQEAEAELVRRRAPLRADVLQVPHHGGARSSSRAFLECVQPSTAVVSCGDADPDHPHPLTLSRYRGLGTRVLRTDLDGALTVVSDGAEVWAHGHARREEAQKRSPISEQVRAIVSRRASGLCSPMVLASGESLPPTARTMSRAKRARTSGASSKRLSRNRRMLANSAGVMLMAADLTSGARSSEWSLTAGDGSLTSESAVSRSFTTTVPAARSPSRLLCLWKNETVPPTK